MVAVTYSTARRWAPFVSYPEHSGTRYLVCIKLHTLVKRQMPKVRLQPPFELGSEECA